MEYNNDEIMEYMREEDVKFIRLAFCDVFGKQKNISVMPDELPRAFRYGIAFDASAIAGFGDEARSDLFLHPDPATLTVLPWRPEHGRVVRMLSDITYPDGRTFECDTRALLKKAVAEAAEKGFRFSFGAEQEFYLFKTDESGYSSKIPCDNAGYMDIAPEDRGENVRREICLTLEQMGVRPESSHHEEGPGQNEIDFRFSDPLTAADQAGLFQTVVRTVSHRNGYSADFSARPLENAPGNGFHINLSLSGPSRKEDFSCMIAGLLDRIREITVFLNPTENSYERLGRNKAPGYVTWSKENRSQLVRIPAAEGEYRRIELRSPDPCANPYLAFTLIIRAALYGVENRLALPAPADFNLYAADPDGVSAFRKLPSSLAEARDAAKASSFVRRFVPAPIVDAYCEG
ncbi:MAG: glutamine synthetase family protein [Clostridia bacterium]|nr:glutamine synthetase family protein [Clostridia bacterium]